MDGICCNGEWPIGLVPSTLPIRLRNQAGFKISHSTLQRQLRLQHSISARLIAPRTDNHFIEHTHQTPRSRGVAASAQQTRCLIIVHPFKWVVHEQWNSSPTTTPTLKSPFRSQVTTPYTSPTCSGLAINTEEGRLCLFLKVT